jgi:hypothetical protein
MDILVRNSEDAQLNRTKTIVRWILAAQAFGLGLLCQGCGGGSSAPPAPPALYNVTVSSTDPASGVAITASPADTNALTSGTSSFTLVYAAGTVVTFSAPSSEGKEVFSGWSGCTATTASSCTLTVAANTTVTAKYKSAVTIVLTPSNPTVTVGGSVQFNVSVSGPGDLSYVWTLSGPSGSTQSPGTLSSTGLYQTPYPAPATATVTVTSNADSVATMSSTITIAAPAPATGPALTVDTSAVTHPISPLIYGMNFAQTQQPAVHVPVDRWGGDGATRYNYLLDVGNIAADYYFETLPNTNTAYPDVSDFNTQIASDVRYGSTSVATVPMVGFTTKRARDCGFSVAKYGAQPNVDQYWTDCGDGKLTNGDYITGNDPADTSTPIDQTFDATWVTYLVKKFGAATSGGIAIYELDNEPEYWYGVHRDVHPAQMTYDELINKSLTYAQAVKTADPTAQVSGPVISNWANYFYSTADLYSGWSTGPYYLYNGNPVDREAHGNIPLLAYYLQHFQQAETTGGTRLLDYLDLHTYFAPPNTAFSPAGDTALQATRLNATRVFWDPTYTDPAYTDPNIVANAPPLAPQLIPFMHNLVAANYPGTKLAITEYNWGGQESINGALAQAEILALFGRESLDMGTLWGPPDPVKQLPGLVAFEFFESYDGAGSMFGDGSLAATSGDQSKLAIYAAARSKDNKLTVMVLNKSFGDLTANVALTTSATTAQVWQYSNANLNAIKNLADVPVKNGSFAGTFPAQSITLFVLDQ